MVPSDVVLHAGPLAHVDSVVGLVVGLVLFGVFVTLLRRATDGHGGHR